MRNLQFVRRIVTFICFSLVAVSCPLVVFAEQINVNNWAIEVVVKRAPEIVPVYLHPNDSKESGAIIEVVKSPYFGMSSIVLIKHSDGQAHGFVGGNLSSPGNNLVLIEVQIHNKEKASRSFHVGDISLVSHNGQNLPYVAVSKGDSYLVGKTSVVALKSSQEINVSAEPDESIKMTYCLIFPPKSDSVRLYFQKTKTDYIIEYNKIPEDKKESSSWIELAGDIEIGANLEGQELSGFLATAQDADLRFKSEASVNEGKMAASLSMGASKSLSTKDIHEKLKGDESTVTLSILYMFKGGCYLPGSITILKQITPFEIKMSLEKPKLQVVFNSSFQAEKGDVLAAIGPIKQIDSPVFSIH